LTNVGKRPDNFEFSEIFFRGHNGRGKILKVMKAQANGISFVQEWPINIYRGALIVRTPGTNRLLRVLK
jgi:hypothetical protein